MIVNGKQIAGEVLAELKNKVMVLRWIRQAHHGESIEPQAHGKSLRLAAVLVGDDLEFKKFVELKGKVAESIGVAFKMYQFPNDISTSDLVKEVKNISEQSDGTLIELPLPDHINAQEVLDQVLADKDVDVLSSEGQKLFYENKSKILPPAVEALKIVLEKYAFNPGGKKAAVFGQGILVGKPVSDWLERQGSEVYRIRSKTENPEQYSSRADIIVTGVGKPHLVTGNMVKDGVVVIDFGYGKDNEGRMRGDVDYNSVAPKASFITPVPGGMGPILIASVLKNLISLNDK